MVRLAPIGLLVLLALSCLSFTASAAEMVSLSMPNGTVRGYVVRVTKMEVVLKDATGKEQIVPIQILKPKEVYACKTQVLDSKDAKGFLELGEYCQKNGMEREAKDAFTSAVRLDASLTEKVAALTGTKAPPPTTPPVGTKIASTAKTEDKKDDKEKKEDPKEDMGEGDTIEVITPDGRRIKLDRRFVVRDENIPELSPADFKKFCDDRLAELKKVIGGDWRYDETKHYVCFSNIPLATHNEYKQYNEDLYALLCTVLQHKEGDSLWNNKCPLYYFNSYTQFQKFAVEIDHSPGGTSSGGYFSHHGRECHVAIPFYDKLDEKRRKREAKNTLFHEGTHAFLQLTGKNVTIKPWLHEGMAQFIEFWFDPVNNESRNQRVMNLRECFRGGDILDWEASKMRPVSGADHVGYSFAWSRVEFLYRCFPDKTLLPKMVKLIKDGKNDEEAVEKAFGFTIDKINTVWEQWVKDNLKTNFRF